MLTKNKAKSFGDTFLMLGLFLFALGLIIYPKDTSFFATKGINLCLTSVFPSLFPFFVFSSMVINMGIVEKSCGFFDPIAKKIFGISGSGFSAFILGILGGYPVGTRTAISLYENGICSKKEVQRLLLFCNNSGPAFILGVVGVSIFQRVEIGFLLYFIHILASIFLAIALNLIFGNAYESRASTMPKTLKKSFPSAFIFSVKSGMDSMLSVSAFVIFFGVIIGLLEKVQAFTYISQFISAIFPAVKDNLNLFQGLIAGFLEMTNGLFNLQGTFTVKSLEIASFLLGWAGMSVHFQAISFMEPYGFHSKSYLICKLFQGFFALFLVRISCLIFPVSALTFNKEIPYLYNISPEFYPRIFFANLIFSTIFLIYIGLLYFSIVIFEKKHYNYRSISKRGEESYYTEKK